MTADDSLPSSDLIDGRYQLQECVGQGGMARVYRADDTVLGRVVAIKMLRSELEGAEPSAGRARGEMTALASLNHPALVTLYDAQLVPGRTEYLVMEFVDGPTLAERIAEGPLPPADVAALAADLAEALHVVHSAGIVHRDIKPSNVLLSRAPFPTSRSGAKLADFGISALVDAARLTTPGIVIGTAAYIAPEQLQGAMPAPAADIYSLGLVMLEALTGTRPFPQTEGIGAALARLNSAPEVPADLGPAWSNLLTAMTAAEPGERPTASEVFSAASEITSASAPPPRPTLPAVAAAAAAAAAAGSPAADPLTAPTDALTAAVTSSTDAGAPGPTAATPSASSTATSIMPVGAASAAADPPPTRVLSVASSDARSGRSTKRRRIGVVGAAAAVAAGAAVVAGAWMTGSAVPEPAATNPADTGPSEPAVPTPVAPVETGDPDVAGSTADDRKGKDDRKAQKDAEKAAEEQQKAAEEAQEEAEEAAEEAEEQQQEAEPTPDSGTEPPPDTGTEPTPDGGTETTPLPSPAPAG